MTDAYAKPSEVGGVLIRKVISLFKDREFSLPITGEVMISVSGGVDSIVLAHLLCTFGRKIAEPSQITLLHFDHGWRKESALEERALVEALATRLRVKFLHHKLPGPSDRQSRNLEEDARLKRQKAYSEIAAASTNPVTVFTAHHESDAVESILWRFLRGEFDEYRQGILFQDSNVIRPFLKVTKEEILTYAQDEKLSFLNDPTNLDPQFFRGWVRTTVFPMLETHFPQIRKTLARYLTDAITGTIEEGQTLTDAVQVVTGSSLNRAQRKALHEMSRSLIPGATLSLPGGTQIRRTRDGYLIEIID